MNVTIRWVIVLALLLTACATPTKFLPLNGFGEGYTETQIDSNIFRVSFHANEATRADYAEDMTLLRSAEVAQNNGFSYFAIINEISRSDGIEASGVASSYITSPTSSFSIGSGISSTSSKPSTTNTIVCFKSKPENVSGIIYNTTFIIGSIGNKYHVLSETERKLRQTQERELGWTGRGYSN